MGIASNYSEECGNRGAGSECVSWIRTLTPVFDPCFSHPKTEAHGTPIQVNSKEATTHRELPLPEQLLSRFQDRKYSKCVSELQELAKQGSTPAAVAMAHIYFYGGGGVRRDYDIARQWLELVANDDDRLVYANYRLGIIHYHGLGVSKNHHAAYRYFRRASLCRDPKSLLMVAAMQREGDAKKRSARTILLRSVRDPRLGIWRRVLALLWAVTTTAR